MTNYEKIKKACQIANPKLMEYPVCTSAHTAICSQAFISTQCNWCKNKFSWHNGNPPSLCKQCSDKYSLCGYCCKRNIDAEPQLSDVLMAINQSKIKDLVFYLGNDFKSLWVYKIGYQGDLDGHPWLFFDLSKPVKDQSPETLQFIADFGSLVLKNNNLI